MTEDARLIVNDLLERSARALLDRDYEQGKTCFGLPYESETFDGRTRVTTIAEFERMFHAMSDYYRSEGITHIDRRCVMAEFRNNDTITSLFETRLVHFDSFRFREPFATLSLIRRFEDGWRVVRSQYAISDSDVHSKILIRKHEWPETFLPVKKAQ